MALPLGGVKFVSGIDFTFPSMTLNVGQNVVVVANLAAFRNRYGSAPNVAGVFFGKLDNGGEELAIQLPAPFDANVLTFNYSDTWYTSTDGFGPSLVVPNPLLAADQWGDRSTWRASASNGGDPDGQLALATTYAGWSALHAVQSVTEDADKDGVPALVEFALGMTNEDTNGRQGAGGLPVPSRAADGRLRLTFSVPANADDVQGHGFADIVYRVQAADTLGNWTTIATKTFGAAWVGTGTTNVGTPSGGLVPVTVTDPAPAGAAPRFVRLQITAQP